MNKFLRYTLKSFAVLAGIMLLLIACIFIYVSANKQELIDKVKTAVSEKLNGEVKIGNIDLSFVRNFPNVSVLFENVSIKDTMFSQHGHPLLEAKKVYGIIGIGNVLLKENPLSGLRIEDGQVYMFTDTSGYTNTYLLSPKKNHDTTSKKTAQKTDFESIKLRNFRVLLDDRFKNKLYDFEVVKMNVGLRNNNDVFTLKTDNDIIIHSLAFNTNIGSYVKESPFTGKFSITFNTTKKQLAFADIDVRIKQQPFRLSGEFNFTEAPTFSLKVAAKNIDFTLAKSLLTTKIATALSIVQLDKPVKEVFADVSGPLKGGEPLVKANWVIEKVQVNSAFINLKNCSLKGSYLNEIVPGMPRNDPNSRLHFQNVTGEFETIPISCKDVLIDNLIFPVLRCDVKADFDLVRLNDLLASNTIRLQDGKGSIDLNYDGPLQDNSNRNTLLNGKLSLTDGLLLYKPRNLQVKNVSGNVLFKNSDVFVTDFKGAVLGNKIMMSGSGKNLLALIKTNPGRMFLDWNIYSPSINLNSFSSLLQKRNESKPGSASNSRLGKTAENLDEVVDYANFRFNLKADELIYSKFKATNVKANISLKNENWMLNTVSLQHAGGQMNISGSLNEKTALLYEANVKVNMENMDVNKVMYAFSNFGQSGIEADNLKGKLFSNAAVTLDINRNTEQPSNINGFVDFNLKDGALLHYDPLKKIQTIIFKKRNFDEIYFAALKDRIDIKDKEITINRMEIQSTALTLFVEGIYSLQGKTDLSIQVPISNLKKRDENYVPENKGADTKAGASIFLRGTTAPDGTVGFKLDVFKKFRKKKE